MFARLLPSAVRHRPYAAAIFVGCVLVSVVCTSYALVIPFGEGAGPGGGLVVAVDALAAGAALAASWFVGSGTIASFVSLQSTAVAVMSIAYTTVLVEIVVNPTRATVLTAHCCVVLVATVIVVRSKRLAVALVLAAPAVWWVVSVRVTVTGFSVRDWASTWVLTQAVAAAAFAVGGTEWNRASATLDRAHAVSRVDDLTGLLNRRGGLAQTRQLESLARRLAKPLWCAFVDVDRFKSVNDQLGHAVGDDVLCAVSRAIGVVARSSDIAVRWGGDEFLVLGVGRAPQPGELEERIVAAIPPLNDSLTTVWQPSVTVGVAWCLATGTAVVDDLVVAADGAMYQRRVERRGTETG
jgi:diguanylate cyclase (GGDEF)-like protein